MLSGQSSFNYYTRWPPSSRRVITRGSETRGNRERAAYCAARNSTRMQMIGRSTPFRIQFAYTRLVSLHAKPWRTRHIVRCGRLFSCLDFMARESGKRGRTRICGSGCLTVTGIIHCTACLLYLGRKFWEFFFSSKWDLYYRDWIDLCDRYVFAF